MIHEPPIENINDYLCEVKKIKLSKEVSNKIGIGVTHDLYPVK